MSEKLTEADRRASLAAQYQNEDDDLDDEAEVFDGEIQSPIRSNNKTAILPDGTRVPTLAYIQQLERIVHQQQKMLERYQRDLARLGVALARQRQSVNLTTSRMSDMSRDLDNKIDRRSDF